MGIKQQVQKVASNVAQYAKDVVTGKAFTDNFFSDSRAFDEWFAHGANEAANLVLHGQPAQVYNRSLSPLQQSAEVDVGEDAMSIHGAMNVEQAEFSDVISRAMEQVPNMPEPGLEQEMSQ